MFYVTYEARFLLFWILRDLLRMSFSESNRETELFPPNVRYKKLKYGRCVAVWFPDRLRRVINNL